MGCLELCNIVTIANGQGSGYCVDSSFLRLALSTGLKKFMLHPDLLQVFAISGVETAKQTSVS